MISGKQAWGVMAAAIVAYELACDDDQLLSVVVDDWLVTRPVTTRLVIAAVAGHLANTFAPEYDLMHLGFLGTRKLARMFRR